MKLNIMVRMMIGGMVGALIYSGIMQATTLVNVKSKEGVLIRWNPWKEEVYSECKQCSFENNMVSCICSVFEGGLFKFSGPIDPKCFENYYSNLYRNEDPFFIVSSDNRAPGLCGVEGCKVLVGCPVVQATKTPYMSVIANYMVFQRCWAWSQGESIAESYEIPQQVLFDKPKYIHLSSSKEWKIWCGPDAQHTAPVEGNIPANDANVRKIIDVGGGKPGLRWEAPGIRWD